MKIFSTKVNSNVESIRKKSSEREFYKHMEKSLNGKGFTKIVPFSGIYFDLLYVQDTMAGLFKFMDTTEDTFSILDEEILEVMEEEYHEVKKKIENLMPGSAVSYNFVMPYVNLREKNMDRDFIIDNAKFEELINSDGHLNNYLSLNKDFDTDEILYNLAKEYFVVKGNPNKLMDNPLVQKTIKYKNLELTATSMDDSQIENINSFRYGSTMMIGSSGTGKTKAMVAKIIKIARLYPKDSFIYITFDKQLSNDIGSQIRTLHPDLKNIRVINYHQFILLLGRKYNLRLNNKSKQSFNKEFEKIFIKVAQIYKDKKYFKGVFIDEAENFQLKDLEFLRNISYSTRNFLYASYDKAKQMSHLEEKIISAEEYPFENIITFGNNYRNSIQIGNFNTAFQNNMEKFNLLEIGDAKDYFIPFQIETKTVGEAEVIEYKATSEMMESIVDNIRKLVGQGYSYSDMCIVYPFNQKVLKGNKHVYSKHMVKTYLEEHEIIFSFADDETNNIYKGTGITLSNIYNVTNLEYKIVFFCHIDVLYNSFNIENKINAKKMINIIYTATSRATEKLYVYLKEDETRPGLIDLLKISSIE